MPDTPRAAPIFVSHCHEDNAWCRAFVAGLVQAGANIWYDEHNMGYGALQEEIERELRARPIFIVILSPTSITKPWVKREMNAAISLKDRHNTRIILPVVAETCDMPLLLREYKRTSGPDDSGLAPSEAAGRVAHALALSAASARTAPVATTETAPEAILRGDGLRVQKRPQEAIMAYQQAIALNPRSADAWRGKSGALIELKRPQEALDACEHALALAHTYVFALTNKGTALLALQRPAEALEAYEQALAIDPTFAVAWNNRGNALRGLKRPTEALEAYERALSLDPTDALPWNGKGAVLSDMGRYDESLAAYNDATTRDPTCAMAWGNKAKALRELGREAEAQAAEARAKALGG